MRMLPLADYQPRPTVLVLIYDFGHLDGWVIGNLKKKIDGWWCFPLTGEPREVLELRCFWTPLPEAPT